MKLPRAARLYLATGNAHKVGELTAIIAAAQIRADVFPPSAIGGMPHVDEDTGTFEGNARKKALALAAQVQANTPRPFAPPLSRGELTGSPLEGSAGATGRGVAVPDADAWLALADDSGLCVDALDGAPGVESAYFAGHPSNDAANNAKLLALLCDVPSEKRTAAFRCCIVAAAPDGRIFAFEGRCPGRVLTAPRGAAGFGYDPLFVPDGQELTAAELASEIKNRISHRARALAQFIAWLRVQG